MSAGERPLHDLLRTRSRGVLVTLKRDGRPQLSTVDYTYDEPTIRVSVTEDRAKTRNLRRDPRASFYVPGDDLSSYAVAEGVADLTAAATEPGDEVADELVDIYRRVQGEHPDWEEYRAAMVADRRVVLRLAVDRVYGWSPLGSP